MLDKCKVTEIFCIADDFCKEFEKNNQFYALEPGTEGKKHRKRKGMMSDSEIITIMICFHYNTFRNFKHYYLFYVKNYLKEEFPQQLSYNRFVERQFRVFVPLMMFLKLICFGQCTGITFVDSTCIPVCHNKRIYSNKVFKGIAQRGKSTMGWYYGFKLHLICNEIGELLNFKLTPANIDDRDERVLNGLTKKLFGKLYADKGYISQKLFDTLFNDGIQLVTNLRSNMKNQLVNIYDKLMLRKRSIIETINDILKNVGQLVHSRHRSPSNFLMNLLSCITAYTFYDTRPCVNADFVLMEGNSQLTLF